MQRRIVWFILLFTGLILNGCGDGGGGGSTFTPKMIEFTSDDTIYVKESEIDNFRFYIKAKGSSRVEYTLLDEKDADIFVLTRLSGLLVFDTYNYKNSDKKSSYEIKVYAKTLSDESLQTITIIIGEKPKPTATIPVTPLTPTPTPYIPIPIPTPTSKLTPTPTPYISTPTPTPKWTPTPTPIPTSTPTPEPITKAPSTTTMVVKKTGQTTSYEPHDDGFYKKGVAPNYSRSGEIVTDHVTGLMWQDSEEAKTVQKNWEDAKNYCSELSLDGYSDWRLPSIRELNGIRDLGKKNPIIDSHFEHITSNDYWSSTTNSFDSSDAWRVYFDNGDDYWGSKTNEFYVRCVRGGQFSLTLVLRKN